MTETTDPILDRTQVAATVDLLFAFQSWEASGKGYNGFVKEAKAFLATTLGRKPTKEEVEALVRRVQ